MTEPNQDAGRDQESPASQGRRVRRKSRPKPQPTGGEAPSSGSSREAAESKSKPTQFGRRAVRKRRGAPAEAANKTPVEASPIRPPREEAKREEPKREDTKRAETKREETKRAETKREETKRDDTKREDSKRQEPKAQTTGSEDRQDSRPRGRGRARGGDRGNRGDRGGRDDRDSRSGSRRNDSRRKDSGRSDSRRSDSPRGDSRRSDTQRSDSRRSDSRRDDSRRDDSRRGRGGNASRGRGPNRGDRGQDRRQRNYSKSDNRPLRRPVDIQAAVNQNLKPTDALQLPPKPLTALIAGGGTGGHVTPAIAVAEALMNRNRESKVVILGSTRGIEADLVPKAGFELVQLPVRPAPRRLGLGYLVAGWRMMQSMVQAYRLIRSLNPDVVIGTGGYVSVAAIVAAKAAHKPTLLQEQNSIPGRANRWLARWADEVHIHFTESRRYFKDTSKLRLSGNPVRVKYPEGRALKTMQKYRLNTDRKTVLVLGGSQGAKSLNLAFSEALKEFRGDRRVQFVIQTGKGGYRPVLDSVKNSGVRVVVKSFIHDIHELYGVADLVVARAGAMTLSELCTCGLPSILVPYPFAKDDHQTANARALEEKDAAVVVADANLTGEVFAREICRLLDSPGTLQRMSRNAFRLSRPNAARHVAEAAEALAGAGPESILAIPNDLGQFETVEV